MHTKQRQLLHLKASHIHELQESLMDYLMTIAMSIFTIATRISP